MPKEILSGEAALMAVKRGIDSLADVVKGTLGPRGRGVILRNPGSDSLLVTFSSAVITRDFTLPGGFENLGARLMRELAGNMKKTAGDGSATAIVLAQDIVHRGLVCLMAGANRQSMLRGIKMGCEAACESMDKQAIALTDSADIARVAVIASGDEHIGSLVAHALEQVGRNGAIVCEEARATESSVEILEGMQFPCGYISPYMVNEIEKNETILKNPYILLIDRKLCSGKELIPLMNAVASAKGRLMIIADAVESDCLATLIENNRRGNMFTLAVNAPEYGDRRREMLKDIAAFTGGTVVSHELGMRLEEAQLSHLGRVKQARATKDKTMLIGGAGDPDALAARIHEVELQVEASRNEHDREHNKARIGRLGKGVAVLRAGGATQTELQDKKLRVDDALNAVLAALEEGVVPGGGVAYANAAAAVEDIGATMEGDEKTGIDIIAGALWKPMRQIADNACVDGAAVIEKVRSSGQKGCGYDAKKEVYADMVTSGIIDPLKVTRSALNNAASLAGVILTAESLIAGC